VAGVGLLCQPVLEEIFFGGPRRRVAHQTRAARAAQGAVVDRGLRTRWLTSTHPDMFADVRAARVRGSRAPVPAASIRRRLLQLRDARGRLSSTSVVESQLKPFDIVPLIPILEGAGAVVTDWQGRRPMTGGAVVAAGTAELHAACPRAPDRSRPRLSPAALAAFDRLPAPARL